MADRKLTGKNIGPKGEGYVMLSHSFIFTDLEGGGEASNWEIQNGATYISFLKKTLISNL